MAESALQRVRTAYRWDKASLRYRSPSGQFVKSADVRRALTNVVNANKRQIRTLAGRLNRGELSVGQWQQAMETAVRDLHLASYAAGRGGFGETTQRDYGIIGRNVRAQYEYLTDFARGIEQGRVTAGRTKARAELYAVGGRAVFENARREAAIASGAMTEERRVLGASMEKCPDCIAEALRKWQPLGTLRRISDSVCRVRCYCRFVFR